MSTDPFISIRDEGGVRYLTLNRVDKANALTGAMLTALHQGIAQAQSAGNQMLVLRSASSRIFCAGADIAEFRQGPQQLEAQGTALRELILAMASCPLPILALAQGRAAGAGVILLALTDIVIAADNLELTCPELAFNMYPFLVQAALETKISAACARQLCLSCRRLSAITALDMGLVTEIHAAKQFENLAQKSLEFYLARREAVSMARKGRLLFESHTQFADKIRVMETLMHENFSLAGVSESIARYLDSLGLESSNK